MDLDPEPEYTTYKRKGIRDEKKDKLYKIYGVKSKVPTIDQELNIAEEFIETSKKEDAAVRFALDDLANDTTQRENAIIVLQKELHELDVEATIAQQTIANLKTHMAKMKKLQKETEGTNNELNDQIINLQDQLDAETEKYNEVKAKFDATLTQIEQLNQDIEQNKKTIAAYEAQLAAVRENLDKAMAERERLRVELENANTAYGALQANYDQSIKDYDMVSGSLVAVRGEKETLQKNLNEASEALRAEQAKNTDLEAKYNTISEDRDKLKKGYDFVYDANEKNKQIANRLLEQYTEAASKADVLRINSELKDKKIVAYEDRIKGLEAAGKEREKLVNFLNQQAKGKANTDLENANLRNQLIVISGERDNAIANRDQAIAEAVEQANKELKEKLKTAGTEKQVALNQLEREFLSKFNAQNDENFAQVEALKRQHAAERAGWEKTYFEQEGLRKEAIEGKITLEKEIKAQINEKEKILDRLKQQKDELKDAQAALKNLKDKFGEQDFLQKQIANLEEQKIELQNEIKVHRDNLSKLKKADKQPDSSPPSGFDFFGPAPARQSRPRRTNANSFFPPPSYSFPPPSYYSPPPPPPSNNFFPSPSYYNPPPPPSYNPAPPSYLPRWPEEPNKLTLEIKVAGGEGGTRAGLDSNLSPVSRPKGDIISKLPFGPYGIEIFQPEKFRKMDTKQDKKKGKKQPTPYQIARSVGKSLFRNLDPLRIRKTSVGTDTTYHALERTPAMFETFGRSTKRRKVTRIY